MPNRVSPVWSAKTPSGHGATLILDAQAQLGHSKMSTTLEIYTLPIPDSSGSQSKNFRV
jgi:hypothetical protein